MSHIMHIDSTQSQNSFEDVLLMQKICESSDPEQLLSERRGHGSRQPVNWVTASKKVKLNKVQLMNTSQHGKGKLLPSTQ